MRICVIKLVIMCLVITPYVAVLLDMIIHLGLVLLDGVLDDDAARQEAIAAAGGNNGSICVGLGGGVGDGLLRPRGVGRLVRRVEQLVGIGKVVVVRAVELHHAYLCRFAFVGGGDERGRGLSLGRGNVVGVISV